MIDEENKDQAPGGDGGAAPAAGGRRWYVVRVQSGREETVKDGLLRRVRAMGLEGKISNVIVPTEKVTEIRSGRKSVREKKLYPGYIMIEMEQDKDAWFLVRETPGIGDFLGLKEPIPMAEHEVTKMLVDQSSSEEDRPKIKIEVQKGDSVRVKDGPFENFDGLVEEVDAKNGRVKVAITVFGRSTPVDLEYWQLEKN
jgi:transcriptional antiterminator NusG